MEVHYSTWHDNNGKNSGQVAVYTESNGEQHVKITVNGVVRSYEQIAEATS